MTHPLLEIQNINYEINFSLKEQKQIKKYLHELKAAKNTNKHEQEFFLTFQTMYKMMPLDLILKYLNNELLKISLQKNTEFMSKEDADIEEARLDKEQHLSVMILAIMNYKIRQYYKFYEQQSENFARLLFGLIQDQYNQKLTIMINFADECYNKERNKLHIVIPKVYFEKIKEFARQDYQAISKIDTKELSTEQKIDLNKNLSNLEKIMNGELVEGYSVQGD